MTRILHGLRASIRPGAIQSLPDWLLDRVQRRAVDGRIGFVFASPAHLDGSQKWDQSNSSAAVRGVLDGVGVGWAIPHTFRRTVATLLHEAGAPLVRIADQLGHADPAMTARVYLGRDFSGDKSDLAQHL
ncbi:hypothetical protein NSZ01_39490 [Nocardioides szechwanensis]|uniref:tyrosine-type recombinase/integrase n=1 Tax=Nocardioides szechwanensis TaxID=1005944 RepID=UPI000B879F97|nr:hypothetical protein NSZ01_39490 [Nocardioides szechwanensis]